MLFDQPPRVANRKQMEAFAEKVASSVAEETAVQQRPNTQWHLFTLTNVAFYLYKMLGIGRVGKGEGRKCPKLLEKNKHISLYSSDKAGKAYTDNLCFFC